MFCTHSVRYRNIANIDADSTNAAIDAPLNDGLRNSVQVEHRVRARALDDHERDQQHDRADEAGDDRALQSSALPRMRPNTSRNRAAENVTVPSQSAPPACGSRDSCHAPQRQRDRERRRSAR